MQHVAHRHIDEIHQLRVEIARLQAAKRRALALADERAKENVALRMALKPFAIACDCFAGTDGNLRRAREVLGMVPAPKQKGRRSIREELDPEHKQTSCPCGQDWARCAKPNC